MEIIQGLPTGDEKRSSIAKRLGAVQVAEYLAEFEPEKSANWIMAQTDRMDRLNVLSGTLTKLTQENPERALEFAMQLTRESGPWPEGRLHVLMPIFQEWGISGDSRAAAAWLAGRGKGPEVDEALSGLVRTIAGKEPTLTAGLLEMSSSPEVKKRLKDQAVGLMTSGAQSIDWVILTAEPADRLPELLRQVRRWQPREPEALRKHLETSPGLTESERAALLPAPR